MITPQPNTNLLLNGDSHHVLKQLPDNSVTAIVTDPPYGLSFMGKKWDYDVPSVDFWKEALRVLTPGGTLLCFAGSRTQHRMACNIEDSGFVLKDCIMWLYGSGFPKALDISKQLMKKVGDEGVVIGEKGLHSYKTDRTPLNGMSGLRNDFNKANQLVEPTDENAKLWNGWKSHGLKPAYEPIIVAMKPNEGSYANNALKNGIGGLNINGCRIESSEKLNRTQKGNHNSSSYSISSETFGAKCNNRDEMGRCKGHPTANGSLGGGIMRHGPETKVTGRFPANIIHDGSDEVVSGFPETKSGARKKQPFSENKNLWNKMGGGDCEASQGSASRFFYCAKASKSERNMGMKVKGTGSNTYNKKCVKCGKWQLKQGFTDDYTCRCKNPEWKIPTGNVHPTVKPVKLMNYLVKLVKQPEKNLILDPFMGSGTTALACIENDVNWIGIEREEEYIKIINARVEYKFKELLIG